MVDRDPPLMEPDQDTKHITSSPIKKGPGRRKKQPSDKDDNRPRTLFDTDGNVSAENILNPESSPARSTRNARKQLADDNDNGPLPPIKRQKLYDHRPMRGRSRGRPPKRTKEKFLEQNPTTPLVKVRNDLLTDKAKELQTIYEHHMKTVKELYHLEYNQNMLDYNPAAVTSGGFHDERFEKFAQSYDLWERAGVYLGRYDLVQMLQDVFAKSSNSTMASSSLATATAAGKKGVQYYTGSEVRRFIRQYPTLTDYLSSFVSIDDNEDITPEEAETLVEKESTIRKRIEALNARGGFSTRLQAIANRRPQLERNKNEHSSLHDAIVSQAVTTSKLFVSNSKHRRNAARKCAKAIERHWELIRTHDERLKKNEERRLMRLAKRTAQHVMKKWKVVERVCEARYKEILKEEQAQEGRRHLQKILEHSEQMLGVRMEELTLRKSAMSSSVDGSPTPPLITPTLSSSFGTTAQHGSNEPPPQPPAQPSSPEATPGTPTPDIIPIETMEKGPARGSDEEFSEGEGIDDDDHIIFDQDESEDDDDELRELEADQDLDVEELIRKYNYRLESETEEEDDDDKMEEEKEEEKDQTDNKKDSDVEMEEDQVTTTTPALC